MSRIELAPGIWINAGDLRMQFARSSGPGGQNVNKVNSKAELWLPLDALITFTPAARQRLIQLAGHRLTASGEIHIDSDVERSQQANRKRVIDALRTLLIEAMREPKKRKKTRPGRAARQRRLTEKKVRSQIKAHRRGAD